MEIIIDKDNRKHSALLEIIAENLSFDKDFAGKTLSITETVKVKSDLKESFLEHGRGIVNPLFVWQDQQEGK